jgi:adenosylmethionine-8-amino-7-oxononanoate aminotransferase
MAASGSLNDPSRSHIFSRAAGRLLTLEKGEGVYVWDNNGRRYIDGSAGPICVNIGYGVKEVVDAMTRQMEKIAYAHSAHFTAESVFEFAEKLAGFAPPSLNKVFFCSGGSEATEAAAKLARQYHLERGEDSRYKVVARWQSYHGNTLGALSMSGNIARRRRYVPMLLDFPHIPPAYCYRCPFQKTRDAGRMRSRLRLGAGEGDKGRRPPVRLRLHSGARRRRHVGDSPRARGLLPGNQGDLR